MARFKLTHKAVEDLSKIWNDTFEILSENQADNYYNMLILSCKEITENSEMGKGYDTIFKNLVGIKINQHIFFYRTIKDGVVEIIRIINESADVKS